MQMSVVVFLCLACVSLARRVQVSKEQMLRSLNREHHSPSSSMNMLAELVLSQNPAAGFPVKSARHGQDHSVFVRKRSGSPPMQRPSKLEPMLEKWLRFRGGWGAHWGEKKKTDDAVLDTLDEKKQLTGNMTREEIVERLNRVPVFCMVQENGNLVSVPDPEGGKDDRVCTFYFDASEAEFTLQKTIALNSQLPGLRLQAQGLGDVFTLCDGFAKAGDAPVTETGRGEKLTLKLQATRAVLKHVESQLIDALEKQGLGAGAWRVPVFVGEVLAQAGPNGEQLLLPIFFSPNDLAAACEAAGVPQSEMEKGFQVMDLRALVARMAEKPVEVPNPWRAIQFVTMPAARQLAERLFHKETE